MSLKFQNRFQPLQEEDDKDASDSIKVALYPTVAEEADQDLTNVPRASSGWTDDISLSSSEDSQYGKPSTTEKRGKKTEKSSKTIKKKDQKLKAKLRKHPKNLTGPEACLREAKLTSLTSVPISREANISSAFPTKFRSPFPSSSSMGCGGGLSPNRFNQTPGTLTQVRVTTFSPQVRDWKPNPQHTPLAESSPSQSSTNINTRSSSSTLLNTTQHSTQPAQDNTSPVRPTTVTWDSTTLENDGFPFLNSAPVTGSTHSPSSPPSIPKSPDQQKSIQNSNTIKTVFTYRAQLTFGIARSSESNVADFFLNWYEKSTTELPDFALLPFDSHEHQLAPAPKEILHSNEIFFKTFYGNHRVLRHGNLTGMVHFRTTLSWSTIKSFKNPYFSWMRTHRVFLNYTKFKTDTLVACGFLVGAHPGHVRREEAEEEIRGSLGLDPEELDFQLSTRSISVPIQEGDSARFTFQALVIKTSTKNATILRERFYEFQPSKIVKNYPYTGLYPFVPMIKSKEWSIQKIHQLAQLHVSILNDLKAIYVSNILDIHHLINDKGESLLQYFLTQKTSIQHNNDANLPEPLFHSIHNTA